MESGRDTSALVHIGVHKTGTTAFQQWASRNREALRTERDVWFYEGPYGNSHFELALVCIRPERTIPMSRRFPDAVLNEWREEHVDLIRRRLSAAPGQVLISAESLSLLRHEDELARLKTLLSPRTIRVAVCLREQDSFLRSYRGMLKGLDQDESPYYSSHAYVEDDTWIRDWPALLETWRGFFGEESVVRLQYEDSMSEEQSTIPGVLRSLGIQTEGLPTWDGDYANSSSQVQRVLNRIRVIRASATAE